MKKQNSRAVIFVIIIIIFIQSKGYYNRNLKVDDDFLTTIAQSIELTETMRLSGTIYTFDDYKENKFILNDGEMGMNSNAEMEIAIHPQVMSKYLYKYNDAILEKNTAEANENLEKYFENFNEVKQLLEKYRSKNESVDNLWNKGIFQ